MISAHRSIIIGINLYHIITSIRIMIFVIYETHSSPRKVHAHVHHAKIIVIRTKMQTLE